LHLFIIVEVRRVGVVSVVAILVVSRRKLQRVIFDIVLHVGSVTAFATVGDSGMVVFSCFSLAPSFMDGDMMLIVLCVR
jgi:hypothetical protein